MFFYIVPGSMYYSQQFQWYAYGAVGVRFTDIIVFLFISEVGFEPCISHPLWGCFLASPKLHLLSAPESLFDPTKFLD